MLKCEGAGTGPGAFASFGVSRVEFSGSATRDLDT
jgi:hypothetical protein